MGKVRKHKGKKFTILIIILFLGLLFFALYGNGYFDNKELLNKKKNESVCLNYNEYMVTNKVAILYDEEGNEKGKIGDKVELSLNEDNTNEMFNIGNLDGKYYIKCGDVEKVDELGALDERYKNYIVFNENIVTNDVTNFYDDSDNLIYSINDSFDLPIIIKDDSKYGTEFDNKLLYVKKEDVKEVKENNNTELHNASGVVVLNYHAFYDENNEEEKNNCTTVICHSMSQFRSHLDYFKENNILTIKVKELEMYIDGKLQLPKSVLITIDDGVKSEHGVELLTEYKMYGTIFLITSWFDVDKFYKTEYIELHSHSDNLHELGDCPMGQGGGIQCLSEEVIQKDLKASREKLGGTTYFCYPFYEFNDYSERMLKKAGFTMAFIGESSGDNLVHVNSNKFKLKRFVIVKSTTLSDFDRYFSQIE